MHLLRRVALAALLALCAPTLASAAIYGPWPWVDKTATPTTSTDAFGNTVTTYPQLAGAFAITDQATYQANIATLSAYAVAGPLPAQNILAGDDPAHPAATVILKFPDFATAQTVMTQVNGAVTQPPPGLPAEMAMYRVKVIMAQTPSSHGGTLKDRVPAYIATLSTSQQLVANEMWASAPNLVLGGTFAQGFKTWEGLSDAAWSQLVAQAAGLPL